MKNVFFDIECYNDLFAVSFLEDGEITDFVFHKTIDEDKRKSLKEHFIRKDVRLIGFNSLHYDMPMVSRFLGFACGFEKQEDIKDAPEDLITMRQMSDEIISTDRAPYYVWRKGSYDIQKDCARSDSLKKLAAKHNFDNLLETPIPFDVTETSEDDVKEIMRYCHNDVRMTEHVFNTKKIQGSFNARIKLDELYDYYWDGVPFAKTTAEIAEFTIHNLMFPEKNGKPTQIKREVSHNFSDIIDSRVVFQTPELQAVLEKYKGFHYSTEDCDKPHMVCYLGNLRVQLGVGGIHADIRGDDLYVVKVEDGEYVAQFDVSSYYPSLIEQLQIAPKGYEGLPDTISTLKKLRAEAPSKEEGSVFKLLANAPTGRFQYKNDRCLFYCPKSYHQMTINGQLFLLELAESLHLAGFSVPQVNTDSVSVLANDQTIDLIRSIVKEWEKKYKFTMTQEDYHGFIQSNVNNYLCVDKDKNIIKAKGSIWGDVGDSGTPSRPKIVTKMKVNHLLYGTLCSETVGDPLDYVWIGSASKTRTWVIQDGEDSNLNVKGANRLYIGKEGFEIGTVDDESGKYVSKASGKKLALCNSGLETLSMDSIDHSAYAEEAEKDLAKMNIFTGHYQSEVYFNQDEDSAEDKEYNKLLRKVLKKAKIITRGNRGRCPDPNCGGNEKDKVASLWKGMMHCFKCDKFFSPYDMSQLGYDMTGLVLGTPVETPEAPVIEIQSELKVTKTSVPDIPDYVWEGKLGELADITGKRDHIRLVGLFSTLSSLFIDRGIFNHADQDQRIANFTLLIAPYGSGKGVVDQIQHTALDPLYPHRRMFEDVASGEALKETMFIRGEEDDDGKTEWTTTPTHFYFDEWSTFINTASRQNNTMVSELAKFYSKVTPLVSNAQKNITSKKESNSKRVDKCELTIFANTTPLEYKKNYLDSGVPGIGALFSRFYTFYAPADKKDKSRSRRSNSERWADTLSFAIQKIANNGIALKHEWLDMIDDDAEEYMYRKGGFYERNSILRSNGELTEWKIRDGIKLISAALTLALANGRKSVSIGDIRAAEWLMEYAEASREYLSTFRGDTVNLNPHQEQELDIDDKLTEYVKTHPNKTKRQIMRSTRIPTSTINLWIKNNQENLKTSDLQTTQGDKIRNEKGYTWISE